MIWEAVAANLDQDLELSEQQALADFDGFLEQLHAYVEELGDTMINDGLHTLGLAPEEERLVEFVVQLTRLANGLVPSLRESLVMAMGCDYDDVDNRGKHQARFGNRSGGEEVLRAAHEQALALVRRLAAFDFHGPKAVSDLSGELLADVPEAGRAGVMATLDYIARTLVPNIRLCGAGCGPGCLRRPFSSSPVPRVRPAAARPTSCPPAVIFIRWIPNKIPSPAAWEVGVRLGDAPSSTLSGRDRQLSDSIGILVYGTVTMRTRGDDLAEILYLMGLKPL